MNLIFTVVLCTLPMTLWGQANFVTVGKYEYYIETTQLADYDTAVAACRKEGAILLVLSGKKEDQDFHAYVRNANLNFPLNRFSIGMRKVNGRFQWDDGTFPQDDSFWLPGQPSTQRSDLCVAITFLPTAIPHFPGESSTFERSMSSLPCDRENAFICRRGNSPTTRTRATTTTITTTATTATKTATTTLEAIRKTIELEETSDFQDSRKTVNVNTNKPPKKNLLVICYVSGIIASALGSLVLANYCRKKKRKAATPARKLARKIPEKGKEEENYNLVSEYDDNTSMASHE